MKLNDGKHIAFIYRDGRKRIRENLRHSGITENDA